jgi:hypothetical protein
MEFKNFLKLFRKNEIEKIENINYFYLNRKKIVTYVPLNYVDKLTFEMSFAGAGKIGNYDMCSFRMKGLGTYMPGSKAKPFIGKKGKLSFEEEVRLEIECSEENLDNVVDALLSNHPYEEVAYEIYDFKKRSGEPATVFITFKKPFTVKEIISRINKKIQPDNIDKNVKIKKLFFTSNNIDKQIINIAREKNCKFIVFSEKNKIKFKYI